MNRRSFFSTMASAGAVAVLPIAALAVPYKVPHVYLARSEELMPEWLYEAHTRMWRETWRHSTDPGWARTVIFTELTPYEERHRFMEDHYEWEKASAHDQQAH